MKIIMLVYFTYRLFLLIKSTKQRLNYKEFQESGRIAKEAYRKMLGTYPPEYHEALNMIMTVIMVFVQLVHIWLCTYLCVSTQNVGLKILCYAEVAATIYIWLTHWKEIKSELFNGNNEKLTYHRFEEIFGVLLGYACYITAIITLISK